MSGKPFPTTLDVDDGPYPSEAALDAIRTADAVKYGANFMVHTFPLLCAELAPYAYCSVSERDGDFGRPVWLIEFSTNGWSGCEDFIDAVLGNMMVRMMWHESWRRGGHYTFAVPCSQVKE